MCGFRKADAAQLDTGKCCEQVDFRLNFKAEIAESLPDTGLLSLLDRSNLRSASEVVGNTDFRPASFDSLDTGARSGRAPRLT
jgi:hypothetical protein